MLSYIIRFSLKNKLIILLFTVAIVAFGTFSLFNIPIGAVPDVTNNQVQVITTSRNLSTQDVEQFITYPVELEMANLPGVREIRSISKFGLSVVTIVFDDDMGTYLPRQLISEKIKSAAENIPPGFGSPEMGPISTGLGEIYQYVLEVDPEYRHLYSIMDLRTIQDWVVKRHLSGIPGVVEVNTWGGFLKQYEVAINPEKLRAHNLAVVEVFEALNKNNSVAGGGYIEKSDQAYFVRGEGLVKSIQDIENIIVQNHEGIPIYIRDIAEVGFGHAVRFGAITGNGEGEKVLGQIMMLKDANSKSVIEAVKQRVDQIQDILPQGIAINPFLERSELIAKTTFTVAENLILGCLIVIFVVVLLLGNLRSGLVVASVIPLSLLFALTMMYLFDVDANLMSLGAIDFGIIIDGAVIIVEYVSYKIVSDSDRLASVHTERRKEALDEITYSSTNRMMHSAIFGQLIIIIVFIPILSLANVEGKMFRPMALTFCFALIGAIILCFTYIPVVSSMFLKPNKASNKNISQRLIEGIQGIYQPILEWALSHTRLVLGAAVVILVSTFFIFRSLGGEFVPTLDEGDFVIQPVLQTGTSLSRTVEITTQIERVVGSFPEVEQVVTRIGAAEVPTDPMSMEETDVIITLIPKDEWKTAQSKDELANLIKEELQGEIPNVDYEFTQPIEMRFNELITGVRADLAIKIFGEDLEILTDKAYEIAELIQPVEGASDIIVEKIEGLPQMRVRYDRSKIARYGLNISEVNDLISMGFAGKVAGSVFEGEKRFDLVVRFNEGFRKDINHIKNANIITPGGYQVPLSELAEITYSLGPAKISRDDTKRRIVVSVNVRNRDLESVVKDVSDLVEEHVVLPTGYRISYGGQFENLQHARERLSYAVPIALILIFVLLHFAFRSITEALMIYSAIPLAAVGGVLFLWIRGLPFSISAGVGFIALFGIAVLNGIVLIEHYKNLKINGFDDVRKLIIEGTMHRLRPVLLTASAAALGFLPMAISTSTGAEVQRPLATVVIGGLLTSTMLTLLVLPVLYQLVQGKKLQVQSKVVVTILLLLCLPLITSAQSQKVDLEQAISMAKSNNAGLSARQLNVDRQEALIGSAFDPSKTLIYYNYDENNIAPNDEALKVWGIQQDFQFPSNYLHQFKLKRKQLELAQREFTLAENYLVYNVSSAFYEVIHYQKLVEQYAFLDSIYSQFYIASARRFELGETNALEKITSETKKNQVGLELNELIKSRDQAYHELLSWLQSSDSISLDLSTSEKIVVRPLDTLNHPGFKLRQSQLEVASQTKKVEQNAWLPDLQLEYFRGTSDVANTGIYNGIQIGVGIPLFFTPQRARASAARINEQVLLAENQDYKQQLRSHYNQMMLELKKQEEALENYQEYGRVLSEALISNADQSFQNGEIDFLQYIQLLDRGVQIRIDYLYHLNQYNQTALSINYIMQ